MYLGFTYTITKKNTVMIRYHGKHIYTVGEKKSAKLISTLLEGDEEAQQMALAKVTGNFKRGNEKRS